MKIVYYIPDLFFRARVEEVLKNTPNIEFHRVQSLDGIEDFDYLIVNLEDEGTMAIVENQPTKVICYCAHVKIDLINKAKQLGCKHVYPRSAFFGQLPKIIAQ